MHAGPPPADLQNLASCIAHISHLFADRKSRKFSKTAKLEIQQNWKTGNSTKLEIQQNWKFNKNWKRNKSGFITKTAKRESYEAALPGIEMSRRAGIQENNGVFFWHSPPRHSTNLEWSLLYTHSERNLNTQINWRRHRTNFGPHKNFLLYGTIHPIQPCILGKSYELTDIHWEISLRFPLSCNF